MLQATEHGLLFLELNLSKLYLGLLPEEFHVDAVNLFSSFYSWTLLYDVGLVAQAGLEQTCLAGASPTQSQSRKSTHQEAKTVNPETSILH